MRKALTITLVAALALFAGSAAYANYCARDVVPASTILVPYAIQAMNGETEVNPQGYATLLTITNVSRDAQIIHITVWSADSEACLDFNEVLTGYDVWTINFRDMISGNFAAFDTSRASSWKANTGNRMPFEWGPDGRSAYQNGASFLLTPQATTVFASDDDCYMPYGTDGPINIDTNIECLRSPLFSREHDGCGNFEVRNDYDNDWLNNISDIWTNDLWFYVTIDVVDQCNLAFPNTLDFFDDFYLAENVLIGDIIYLNETAGYSEAINAVHLESQYGIGDGDPNTVDLPVNFYEEIDDPDGSSDVEPLATGFAFNFYNNQNLQISTDVLLWKNFADFYGPLDDNPYAVDDCGYYMYYVWDQDEHTTSRASECRVSPCNPNDIDPNEFPFESQAVPVTQANFDLVGVANNESGWMLILLPPTYHEVGGWADPTPEDTLHPDSPTVTDDQDIMMGWVGVRYKYADYSAGLEAATMANTHCYSDQVMPYIGVNYNYQFVPPTE